MQIVTQFSQLRALLKNNIFVVIYNKFHVRSYRMAKVLIIDDDTSMCTMLKNLVRRMGHEAYCRHTLSDGVSATIAEPYDVVFLDVQMPDGNGLDVLFEIRNTQSSPEVIIMTGFGNADGAELAIKNGAWDYIQKTDSTSKIVLPLQRVLQYRESLKKTQQPPARALKLNGIVGDSTSMKACYDLVAQAAATDSNVLLTGETGTGKELFAQAIHHNSDRKNGHFVVVDCAALPENLVESLLFGHEKGAYTGAEGPREGLIAQAHKGTLFLDEIGELPLKVQKVLLRVLQERRYRSVGGKKERKSDFRLLSATNRDLDQMTRNSSFRKDLLFRLRTLSITLPPLRKRSEDIKALVTHHLASICDRQGIGMKGISSDFTDTLMAYAWPGNLRELVNTIESAVSVAIEEEMLFSWHIPDYIRIEVARASVDDHQSKKAFREGANTSVSSLPTFKSYRRKATERSEKEYLEKLWHLTKGDVQEACRISKLSRSRYYELIKLHRITTD